MRGAGKAERRQPRGKVARADADHRIRRPQRRPPLGRPAPAGRTRALARDRARNPASLTSPSPPRRPSRCRMQAVLSNLQRELRITFVYVTTRSPRLSDGRSRVIMSRGRIEQVGPPQAIYRRRALASSPSSPKNVFAGRVSGAGERRYPDRDAVWRLRGASETDAQSGSAATFVVSGRPDPAERHAPRDPQRARGDGHRRGVRRRDRYRPSRR